MTDDRLRNLANGIIRLMNTPNGLNEKIISTLNNPMSTSVDLETVALLCSVGIQLAIVKPKYKNDLPIYVRAFNSIISDTRYTNEQKSIEKVRTALDSSASGRHFMLTID